MTKLYDSLVSLPCADFNGESTLPPISERISIDSLSRRFCLDEDDGLFLNYGEVECAYPYRYQNLYDRAQKKRPVRVAVLENDLLKATFLPDFGGKLWSLFDKTENRELLFCNKTIRPCNLAVRNAWLSGGIEWNPGFRGHGPYTCSPVNTAKTALPDGTPVLRFYYFERIRCAVVQMDFFLPEGASFLFARMRLTNPNDTVVPMYWWSNAAVPDADGNRVIVPAEESYSAPFGDVIKIKIPMHRGVDVSYPRNSITACDYFWKTKPDRRPYVCEVDREGYGILQTSTERLKGRKLFVWGNTQGGEKWQNYLTLDDEPGSYNEIQCGLAHTQYECLPMPPHTAWEWLEAWGPVRLPAEEAHGAWETAQKTVEDALDRRIGKDDLQKLLEDTHAMAVSREQEEIQAVDGWGALEEYRRQKENLPPLAPHLSFGKLSKAQKDWKNLSEHGSIGVHAPNDVPASYMRQSAWLKMLKDASEKKDKNNWYAFYQLGCAAAAEEDYASAEAMLTRSFALADTAWSACALAIVFEKTNRLKDAARQILHAYSLRRGDVSMAKETYRLLSLGGNDKKIISLFEKDTPEIQSNARCRLYYARALARTGRARDAEAVLCGADGNLLVPDIREGELTVTELWYDIQKALYGREPSDAVPPKDLDFRMSDRRKEWFDEV